MRTVRQTLQRASLLLFVVAVRVVSRGGTEPRHNAGSVTLVLITVPDGEGEISGMPVIEDTYYPIFATNNLHLRERGEDRIGSDRF